MKKRLFMILAISLSTASAHLFCQEIFRFKHLDQTQYRILSSVNENVYINSQFSHNAQIVNKVSVSISSDNDTRGEINASFYLTEKIKSGEMSFNGLSRQYQSNFERDEKGNYYSDKDDWMPVVRKVPFFPERAISPGESWVSNSYEVHDFRAEPLFIKKPYPFPILVNYTYIEKIRKDNKYLHKIKIEYTVFHTPVTQQYKAPLQLSRIMGHSSQILYWDNIAGRPHSYKEEFELVLKLSDKTEIEFSGTASAIVLQSEKMNKENLQQIAQKTLEDEGLKEFQIKKTEKGLSLTFNDINFYPDSDKVLPGEEEKIKHIASLLEMYPERDIIIVGHTALAGSQEEQNTLSLKRAARIADYLIEMNSRPSDRVMIEGRGAQEPIADNISPEGMRQNRRVEILILEN